MSRLFNLIKKNKDDIQLAMTAIGCVSFPTYVFIHRCIEDTIDEAIGFQLIGLGLVGGLSGRFYKITIPMSLISYYEYTKRIQREKNPVKIYNLKENQID